MSVVSRSYLVRFAQLGALWAYSVSQPVFSLLDGNPDFLVVRGATRAEVVTFALLLALLPAAVAVALERVVSLFSREAADVLHLVLLGLFVVPLAMLVLRAVDPTAVVAIGGALALSVVAVACYVKWKLVRLFVTASFVLPLIGLLSFVLGTRLVTENAAGANVRVGNKTPVVMVILDELPATSLMRADGSVDGVRFPNFGRLARSATWYSRASTVHDHTTSAIPSILTGMLPRAGVLPRLADHPSNLFTLLGESYDMRVHEEVTYLCPKRYCPRPHPGFLQRLSGLFGDVRVAYLRSTLPESMAGGLPQIADRWSGFQNNDRLLAADDQADVDRIRITFNERRSVEKAADDFVAGFRRAEPTATLHVAHFLLPHAPYHFLPSGREYDGADRVDGVGAGEAWIDDPALVEQRYQRHLLQVGYADALLGRILDRMQRTGMYDRALVLVVADHGVSFRVGVPRRPVTSENLGDIARVPLLVKLPGQHEARIDERPVRTVDLVPTIADVVDVRVPWKVDGKSLLRPGVSVDSVEVRSRTGALVRGSVAEVDRQEAATLQRKSVLFGQGADSLYATGRHSDLLGRSTRELRVRPAATTRVALDSAALFVDVRLSSPFVPVRITGTIDGTVEDDAELAVAVNGRVVAFARVSDEDGERRFDAVVPEAALREGFNQVEILSVSGTAKAVRLTSLGGNER